MVGRLLATATVALGALSVVPTATATPDRHQGTVIELVEQTPVAVSGQSFVVTVRLDGVPADGSVALTVHQRIRSRSELALSMEGEGLRGFVFGKVTPMSDLPAQPDGTRRVVLSLDPADGGLPLPSEGVYPVELTAQDAAGSPIDAIVTHLIVPPEEGDDAPNLAVALVADLAAPIALKPDGTASLGRSDVDAIASVVAGLVAAPEVPATLSAQPETIDALLASTQPGDAELVASMRAAAEGRTVLDAPYVPVDVDALVAADLTSELAPQQESGRAVLTAALGVTPDDAVRVAPPTLGAAGLGTLAFLGAGRLVVDDEHLEPLAAGIISYSLAQPFVVAVPEEADADDPTPGPVFALAPDPVVVDHLAANLPPGLVVSRVLAELALIRLEQPSVARAAVVPLPAGLSADTVEQLLRAVGTGRPFEPMSLAGAFEHAAPVLDGGGNPADRALLPDAPDEITPATALAVREGREALATFVSLVGRTSALPDVPRRHLLAATAAGLDDDDRQAHVDAASAAIEAIAGKVTTPPTFTLTLTSRDGTVPLTIHNDSGVPVRVSIHLRSQKLEFPDGATISQLLTEETTRIDIRVRSRATGAFPLIIDVRTPDSQRSLATSRFTVRSTAVSGVGLILSLGAGLFLTVWWARHWRRTRRSQKLIAANGHPSASA